MQLQHIRKEELFGPEASVINVSLDVPSQCVLDDIDKQLLIKPFTVEEVKHDVFQMKHNKSPGPDGFPRLFPAFLGLEL